MTQPRLVLYGAIVAGGVFFEGCQIAGPLERKDVQTESPCQTFVEQKEAWALDRFMISLWGCPANEAEAKVYEDIISGGMGPISSIGSWRRSVRGLSCPGSLTIRHRTSIVVSCGAS